MKEAKFTPGPWHICWGTYDGSKASFHVAASLHGSTRPIVETKWKTDWSEAESKELEANAHLIAAAPDLYEACAEFVRKVEAGEARSTRSYRQMKAALAKASGESQ